VKLFIMRHAHAKDGAQDDPTRGITDKGREQCKAMRQFIKDAHLKFDWIYSSKFDRAVQTVEEIFSKGELQGINWNKSNNLAPTSDVDMAWETLMGYRDDWKVLCVTHHPLIEKLVSSIAFGFSPDVESFAHCTLIRLDTHPLPDEVHPLRWMVTPNLANRLQEAEVYHAICNMAESLDRESKASVVNPLIDRLRGAVSRHFAREWAEYRRKGKIPARYRDGMFTRVFNSCTDRAYSGGADLVAGQLQVLKEAKYTTKKRPPGYTVRGEDVESNLRDTSNDLIAEIEQAGVAAGLSAAVIMEEIRQQFKDWGGDRAATVATHEISRAYHTGGSDMAVIVAEEIGSHVTKTWAVQDDPCEVCQENADEGPLSEDEQFPSGDAYPPAHPNCRCSIDYGRAEA
jgi:phosphohistidine phosphatase SixA